MKIEIKLIRNQSPANPRKKTLMRVVALLALLALVLAIPASAKYMGEGNAVFSTALDSAVYTGTAPISVSSANVISVDLSGYVKSTNMSTSWQKTAISGSNYPALYQLLYTTTAGNTGCITGMLSVPSLNNFFFTGSMLLNNANEQYGICWNYTGSSIDNGVSTEYHFSKTTAFLLIPQTTTSLPISNITWIRIF